MAARITRGKKKIATAGIPYREPAAEELASRVDAVVDVIHLVFTTGHTAPSGSELQRRDLTERGCTWHDYCTSCYRTNPSRQGSSHWSC